MKTHTIILLLVVSLVGATALPACAQGKGEIVKKGVEEVLTSPSGLVSVPSKIAGIKRFSFPEKETAYLQQSLAATLERASIQNSAAAAQTQTPAITSASNAQFLYDVLAGDIPHKKFLVLMEKERKAYEREISHAASFLNQIKSFQAAGTSLGNEQVDALVKNLLLIKNDSLRFYVFQHLVKGELEAAEQELSDYFSIGKSFEDAALSYTTRHPHKRNLQTLRLLHNPFINDALKAPIKNFLWKSSILPEDQEPLRKALQALYREHQRIMKQISKEHKAIVDNALVSEEALTLLAKFDKAEEDLENFVAENGFRPRWQTRSAEERALNIRIRNLANFNHLDYPFEPFISRQKELEMLWDKYEPARRPLEEVLQALDKFIQETGLLYPRTLGPETPSVSEAEAKLFDDLFHWRMYDEGVYQEVVRIQNKYSSPE